MTKLDWLRSLRGADLTPLQFRVLVILATYANADGSDARPGVDRLIRECQTSRKSIQRSLRQLVEAGHIEVVSAGGGRGRAAEYRIVLHEMARKGVTSDADSTERASLGTRKGVTGDAPVGPRPGPTTPSSGAPLRDCTGDRLIRKRFPIISERFPEPIPGVFDLEKTDTRCQLPGRGKWQPNRSHWRLIRDLRDDHGVLVVPGQVDAVFEAWEAMCGGDRVSANWGASLHGAIQAIAEHLGGPEVYIDQSGYGAGFRFDVNYGEGGELVNLFEYFCDEQRRRPLRAV
ncbi:helix-turn-helix domain-containing protein [Gordonia sp. NPDC003504]